MTDRSDRYDRQCRRITYDASLAPGSATTVSQHRSVGPNAAEMLCFCANAGTALHVAGHVAGCWLAQSARSDSRHDGGRSARQNVGRVRSGHVWLRDARRIAYCRDYRELKETERSIRVFGG